MSAEAQYETPSGKGSGDENFPVGSWLLPARLRPHVATYYAIARATDDIADNPDLTPDDKLRRLDLAPTSYIGRVAPQGTEPSRGTRRIVVTDAALDLK